MGLIIFHSKALLIIGLLYLATTSIEIRRWFFTYLIVAILMVLGLNWLKETSGIGEKIYLIIMKAPDLLARQIRDFNRVFPYAVGALSLIGVLRVVCTRYLAPKLRDFVHRHLKIRIDSKKGLSAGRTSFEMKPFMIRDDKTYFIGQKSDKTPIILNEQILTQGTQVVGPPGTGKSVFLFNMAVQAIEKGKSCCFVDGKGDMSFIHMLHGYFKNPPKFKDFLFFTPTTPFQSHTYNPLASIQDPGELADLLSVGLNLNIPGPGKVYSDTQKAFLLLLFNLFLNTGKKFNFIDLLAFTNYPAAREYVYSLISDRYMIDDMEQFFRRLKKNEPELLGLTTQIQKLFCADAELSKVVNAYSSDIVVKDVLDNRKFCLFSLSSGKKAETNEALAKMVISDVTNAVGERMSRSTDLNEFAMLILDEFGQYAPTGTFDKFISTARGSKVACILSHQSNAQLTGRDGVDRLAPIVRECTASTLIFRQSEEADFWARVFGTQESMKRTDVIEEGDFLTEKRSAKGSLRATEEFLIHPNVLKRLETGQVAMKSAGSLPLLASVGLYKFEEDRTELNPSHINNEAGLNLRSVVSDGKPIEKEEMIVGAGESPQYKKTERIRL